MHGALLPYSVYALTCLVTEEPLCFALSVSKRAVKPVLGYVSVVKFHRHLHLLNY
jgi:hypothetical protein